MNRHTVANILILAACALALVWLFSRGRVPEGALLESNLFPLEVEAIHGPEIAPKSPMLIDFWATWCGPCVRSIPELNAWHREFASEGLQVVGVSAEEPSTVRHFLSRTPVDYTIALDPEARYFRELEINAIPHAILVRPDGSVAWSGHPGSLNSRKIKRFLEDSG